MLTRLPAAVFCNKRGTVGTLTRSPCNTPASATRSNIHRSCSTETVAIYAHHMWGGDTSLHLHQEVPRKTSSAEA